MSKPTILIAGCGAVGSWTALLLANPNLDFILLDDDRVGQENLGTTCYRRDQVGLSKVDALAAILYFQSGSRASVRHMTLTDGHIWDVFTKQAPRADLVIDTFDNVTSRSLTRSYYPQIPVLHAGVSAYQVGSVIWEEAYQLELDPQARRGENQVCTHALGHNIIIKTAAITATIANQFLLTREQHNQIFHLWSV